MTHGLMSILREDFFLREDFRIISMDEFEISLLFLRQIIISEGRLIVLLKFYVS